MKSDNISWIVFLSLLLALTSAQDPCQPWPQQLKTREECCDLPKYHPTDTETACYNQCGQLEDDLTTLRTCMENCFAANSTVVAKDKKINSNEAMKIPFLFPAGISAAWNGAIADALKKCQLNSTGHLSLDLAQFQYCVREYLKQHCVAFMPNTTGCDLVDEQFRKCMKIEPNCTALWPSGYHKCCDVPEMFKFRDKLVDDCEDKCRNSEYFNIMVRKCFFDCIVNDTKFVVNEKIDYEVVKKMLSFNVSTVWIIPITTVVNKCERAVAASKPTTSTINLFQRLMTCLFDYLSLECPNSLIQDNVSCRKFKEFKNKCPLAKRPDSYRCWMFDIFACAEIPPDK